ncbi:hypothetical protein LshimejAT787_0806380 [Lyophyllum shimeji]|uniref:Mixed lineage kinase domain-containing protein n=1 Tax=Lyophyllum shimeji TaxID=47721 RepID=A0A9P3UPZ8_LYOSH|nr:hypothetical protein LshimejAT787_0806380 [Lyophyllum shimeji]
MSHRGHPPPPPKPPDGWKNSLNEAVATSADLTKTFVTALRDSADAFPPLKSLAGGVLAVWQTAERAKCSKGRAKALAERCCSLLRIIADAVKDPNDVPPEMNVNLENFKILLEDIQRALNPLQKQNPLKSLAHLNRDQDELDDLNRRLDEAYHGFVISSALMTQLQLERIQRKVAKQLIMLGHIDKAQDCTIARLSEIRNEVSSSAQIATTHSDHKLAEIRCELATKLEVIDRGQTHLKYLFTISVGLF